MTKETIAFFANGPGRELYIARTGPHGGMKYISLGKLSQARIDELKAMLDQLGKDHLG